MVITGTDVLWLVAVSGNAAAWVKVFVDAKKGRSNGKDHSVIPPCGASPEMVADHISQLAAHKNELTNLGRSIDLVRTDNATAHLHQDKKLDRLLGGKAGQDNEDQ